MDNRLSSFFKGKKVFLTGHTGFKGSWMSLWLQEMGAELVGYSLEPPSQPNHFELAEIGKDMKHIRGDIRDRERLMKEIENFQPDIVFHMAAQSLVRYSYHHPVETYETNVMGTLNLFEACRKAKSVRVIVNITSDKCYENKEWVYGYRENDPMGGYDPYSSSKGCAEILTSSYRCTYFNSQSYNEHHVAMASVRAGNVIGGGDWALDRIIPDSILSLSRNQEILIRNPKAVRPWEFVLEPLSGYLWLAVQMWGNGQKFSSAWNFGPENNAIFNVEELVRLIIQSWGQGGYKIQKGTHPHEAGLLKLDISRALYELKWRPTLTIDQTVKYTVDWYKNYYLGESDIKGFSIKQIRSYSRVAAEKKVEWAN